jgi:uncharacterized radical SAM superfamily Fe-S cluster-containing enzyme
LPWISRFTDEQGFECLCCVANRREAKLRDNAGRFLRVDQDLTNAGLLNSPDLKAIRAGMLRGHWPSACEPCQIAEKAGATSFRQGYNRQFAHWIDENLAQTSEDGALTQPAVRYADIRLGNMCNLTCRMCGPGASRPWVDHYNAVQLPDNRLTEHELAVLRDQNWVKRQPVRQLIEQAIPTVEVMNFAGGEPLMIPELVEALQMVVDSGRSREVRLQFNTNVTVLPDKVVRLWPHFKQVSLILSVDGYGPLNDYIRRPSKWREIDRNLRRIEENFDAWNLRHAVISATVQIYNVLEIGDLFDYVATNFRRINPIPQLIPLYDPEYLAIEALPNRIKAAARVHLLAVRQKALALPGTDPDWISRSFDPVFAYLDKPSGSPRAFMGFLSYTERCDRDFGDSWRVACPELAKHLPKPGQVAMPCGAR